MKRETYLNNCKACYNGYKNKLTVEWMASMAGVSKSTIYRQIKKHKLNIK